MKRRILAAAVLAYAALSVIETIAGMGACVIVIGEAAKWWDLL